MFDEALSKQCTLLLIAILFIKNLALNLECTELNRCDGQTLICDSTISSERCNLLCNGPKSCDNANFICISQSSCVINCQNADELPACDSLLINATSPEITVNCDGPESCIDSTINANITEYDNGFMLNCFGEQDNACAFMEININGHEDVQTHIDCGAATDQTGVVCLDMNVYCNIGACEISCESDQDESSCSGNTLYCGSKATCNNIQYNNNLWNVVTKAPTSLPTVEPKYIFVDNQMEYITWPDAEKKCNDRYGTHLATIITSSDFDEAVSIADGADVWIGMNNVNGDGWNWIDGANCAESKTFGDTDLCEDSIFWGHDEPEIAPSASCGVIGSDDLDKKGILSDACFVIHSFLCNALPITNYVCMENNNELISVLKYDYLYKYSNVLINYNISYELQWNESSYNWEYHKNAGIKAKCSSNLFVIPQKCSNWEFLDLNEMASFSECPCT